MVKLSILIATMPSRSGNLFNLATQLGPQLTDDVEVVIDCSMEYSIGVKRNKLLSICTGEYVVFIDDDDYISPDYVKKVLVATDGSPDCIGISGIITMDRATTNQWHISREYGYWHEKDGVYYRTSNHISPVRREHAVMTGFLDLTQGEDSDYSRRLLPLLKTENKVEGNIYYYDYRTK